MVRPSPVLASAASAYVPVRVTDMAGVDLDAYDFDRALTLAILLMNADGTVYHRYGSGDGLHAESMTSEASLVRLLKDTLAEHAAYERAPSPPAPRPKRTVEDLPPMKRRLAKGRKIDCVHCHTVGDMEREQAQEERRWSRDDVWRHPPSERVGLTLERDDQESVKAVLPGSPAEKAGVAAGDRLVRLGGARVRTEADVRYVLDRAPFAATTLEIETTRGAEARKATLSLPDGWRRGDALALSWRNDLWEMRPNPGFGGPLLGASEKKKLGLPAEAFALRVDYLIDFGSHPQDGREAKRAGLKKGDVVLGADGVSDFRTAREFQAWWRLTRVVGATVAVDVLSGGERKSVRLKVLP